MLQAGNLKCSIVEKIDYSLDEFSSLSLKMYSNPELSFQEFKSGAWLTKYLEKKALL